MNGFLLHVAVQPRTRIETSGEYRLRLISSDCVAELPRLNRSMIAMPCHLRRATASYVDGSNAHGELHVSLTLSNKVSIWRRRPLGLKVRLRKGQDARGWLLHLPADASVLATGASPTTTNPPWLTALVFEDKGPPFGHLCPLRWPQFGGVYVDPGKVGRLATSLVPEATPREPPLPHPCTYAHTQWHRYLVATVLEFWGLERMRLVA